MNLLFDCDGVMCDWHGGFITLAEQRGYKLNPDHPQDTYAMHEWFENMSDEQFLELVVEFNKDPDHIMHMRPLHDAQTYIPMLAERGHTLSVLTACGDCEESVATRKEMIEGLFPNCFSQIHVIGLRECKKDYLEKLRPDFFVEDNISHAEKSIELDIPTVVIETSYNKGHDVPYVKGYSDTWLDLFTAIESVANTLSYSETRVSHKELAPELSSIFEEITEMEL